MNLNRDASAIRLPSHTGWRPPRCPTQPTVDGEVVVNMPRVNPAVAAVPPRQTMAMEARTVTSVTCAGAL